MEFARKTTGDPEISYDNIFVHKDGDGNIGIYKTTKNDNDPTVNKTVPDAKHLIGYLPKVGTNLQAKQPDANAKREIPAQGNTTTPTHTTGKKKIAGF